MILYPKVKSFIESYIKDIEDDNIKFIIEESLSWLNDAEFNQLATILDNLQIDYSYEIDDIITEYCEDIIKINSGRTICIDDEWRGRAMNYLGNKDLIIEQFDDFDFYVERGKYWCLIT